MMNARIHVAGLLALSLATAGAAHAANLVSDGTFTSPYGGPGFTEYTAGSSFGPWTVTSGSVDLIGGYWQGAAGGGSVDVDGSSPGAFSQVLSTGAGNYTLTFDLSGNPDRAPATKTLQVSIGDVTQTFTYTIGANTRSNMMYVPETLTFKSSGPTTLTFASLDGNHSPSGPVVSDVGISSGVPEPAAWALMLLGLGSLGAVVRSQRSRVAALA